MSARGRGVVQTSGVLSSVNPPFKYLLCPTPLGQFPDQPVVPRCCSWSCLGHLFTLRALCTVFFPEGSRREGFWKIPSEAMLKREGGCLVRASSSWLYKCCKREKILLPLGCVLSAQIQPSTHAHEHTHKFNASASGTRHPSPLG